MSEELIQRFQRSGKMNQLEEDIVKHMEKDGILDSIMNIAERIIMSDLESNPGLLSTIPAEGELCSKKVNQLFEKRIKSELMNGLMGGKIDDYFNNNKGMFLKDIENRLKRPA